MGEWSRQLLEVNGDSGVSRRLTSDRELGIDDLNEVRRRLEASGHQVIMAAIESGRGEGLVKTQPDITTTGERLLEKADIDVVSLHHRREAA